MTREEFFNAVEEGGYITQHLNDKAIIEGFSFFEQDAASDCSHFTTFQKYYGQLFSSNKVQYYHRVHLVNMQYIVAFENMPSPPIAHLGYLYLCEAEYYIGVNVYSECIRNIFNALELPALSSEYVATGFTMLLTLLWDNRMTTQACRYINSLEMLLNKKVLPPIAAFLTAAALMESYSVLGNNDKSNYYANYLETEIKREDIADAYYSILTCNKLSCYMRQHPNQAPTREFIRSFRNVIKEMATLRINDNFAYTFLPLFRYILGYIKEDELIVLIRNMISMSRSSNDKLSFYDFLIDEVKLDPQKYNTIYDEYYRLLRQQHITDADNRRQVIESEIISHELAGKYKKSATTDSLTEIGNRLAYTTCVDLLSRQKGGLPNDLGIVMMDVNGLKDRNDSRGHDAGDAMLRVAASLIKINFSEIGSVYRIGGDEFVALVRASSAKIASAVREFRTRCSAYDGLPDGVSISVGYALAAEFTGVNGPKRRFNAMSKAADERMYVDKEAYYRKTGKNRRRN